MSRGECREESVLRVFAVRGMILEGNKEGKKKGKRVHASWCVCVVFFCNERVPSLSKPLLLCGGTKHGFCRARGLWSRMRMVLCELMLYNGHTDGQGRKTASQ